MGLVLTRRIFRRLTIAVSRAVGGPDEPQQPAVWLLGSGDRREAVDDCRRRAASQI
jgi:predicted RNA polymerase sigma factor